MLEAVEALPVVISIPLSVVVPLGIFVGRSNIRASRSEIVRDLEDPRGDFLKTRLSASP